MSDHIHPTCRLAHRGLKLYEELLEALAALEQIEDRLAPAAPEIRERVAALLGRTRRLLSRHPLCTEVAPLVAAAAPILPGELLVRLLRALEALRQFFDCLEDLSPLAFALR